MALKEEKIEVKLSVKHGEKKQVFNGFNHSATDDNLMNFARALNSIVDGEIENVAKIEESKLIQE